MISLFIFTKHSVIIIIIFLNKNKIYLSNNSIFILRMSRFCRLNTFEWKRKNIKRLKMKSQYLMTRNKNNKVSKKIQMNIVVITMSKLKIIWRLR